MMKTVSILQFIVVGLIILFIVLWIRRILINSSIRKNSRYKEIGEKLNKLIEQNDKIISLLDKKD